MKSKSTSIVEVAQQAGVSIQTVSNVLNFPERVRPITREHVLGVLKSLDYTPNLSARRLRSKKSSSIAVRIDSNSNSGEQPQGLYSGFIQDEFVYKLVEVADQREIKVINYTAKSEEVELTKLKHFIRSRDVDGLILTSTRENDPRLKLLNSMSVPFLSFGRPWGAPDLYSTSNPWVDVDGQWGTTMATTMFLEQGFRKIGFIGWESNLDQQGTPESVANDRYLGWEKALRKFDKSIEVSNLNEMSAFGFESIESGRYAIRDILKRSPNLDAVVCVSDTVALGAMLELQKLHHENVRVSGFDNSPTSREFGFSSLDQNLGQVAASALDILMGETGNEIRNIDFSIESTRAHVLLKPSLIVR
jgi:DNA-binding LacI/PurR family transcriptional regulator